MYKITMTSSKFLYALWGALVSFTQSIHTAMIGLLVCIAIDTFTGLWAAPYRGQRRESHKLSRLVKKIITYFTAVIVVHIVENLVLPTYLTGTLELARMAMVVFCALECFSVFENLRDITGLRAFEILTLNFKKKIEESVGVEIPKGSRRGKKGLSV